eukprot:31280-Pelagococcus_subviridis.AAC.3
MPAVGRSDDDDACDSSARRERGGRTATGEDGGAGGGVGRDEIVWSSRRLLELILIVRRLELMPRLRLRVRYVLQPPFALGLLPPLRDRLPRALGHHVELSLEAVSLQAQTREPGLERLQVRAPRFVRLRRRERPRLLPRRGVRVRRGRGVRRSLLLRGEAPRRGVGRSADARARARADEVLPRLRDRLRAVEVPAEPPAAFASATFRLRGAVSIRGGLEHRVRRRRVRCRRRRRHRRRRRSSVPRGFVRRPSRLLRSLLRRRALRRRLRGGAVALRRRRARLVRDRLTPPRRRVRLRGVSLPLLRRRVLHRALASLGAHLLFPRVRAFDHADADVPGRDPPGVLPAVRLRPGLARARAEHGHHPRAEVVRRRPRARGRDEPPLLGDDVSVRSVVQVVGPGVVRVRGVDAAEVPDRVRRRRDVLRRRASRRGGVRVDVLVSVAPRSKSGAPGRRALGGAHHRAHPLAARLARVRRARLRLRLELRRRDDRGRGGHRARRRVLL